MFVGLGEDFDDLSSLYGVDPNNPAELFQALGVPVPSEDQANQVLETLGTFNEQIEELEEGRADRAIEGFKRCVLERNVGPYKKVSQ